MGRSHGIPTSPITPPSLHSNVNDNRETEYWLLYKVLYGLKQASYEWFKTLQGILKVAKWEQYIGD